MLVPKRLISVVSSYRDRLNAHQVLSLNLRFGSFAAQVQTFSEYTCACNVQRRTPTNAVNTHHQGQTLTAGFGTCRCHAHVQRGGVPQNKRALPKLSPWGELGKILAEELVRARSSIPAVCLSALFPTLIVNKTC